MTQAEAKALIFAVLEDIAREADLATLRGRALLRDELDLDSIDFLNFVAAIHERTKLEIPEADYGRLAALDEAISYLSQ